MSIRRQINAHTCLFSIPASSQYNNTARLNKRVRKQKDVQQQLRVSHSKFFPSEEFSGTSFALPLLNPWTLCLRAFYTAALPPKQPPQHVSQISQKAALLADKLSRSSNFLAHLWNHVPEHIQCRWLISQDPDPISSWHRWFKNQSG